MEFNARKYAEKMRNSKNLNSDGNVVCPLEVWEHTASMLEEQADEIDRLLNFMCKFDREQEERIQEDYVPYEQYEELLEENKKLKAKRYMLHQDGRLEEIPTVPRCKDCKYCHHNEVLNTYRCTHFNCIMKPEDYCSWGERDEVR